MKKCDIQTKATEQYFTLLLFILFAVRGGSTLNIKYYIIHTFAAYLHINRNDKNF